MGDYKWCCYGDGSLPGGSVTGFYDTKDFPNKDWWTVAHESLAGMEDMKIGCDLKDAFLIQATWNRKCEFVDEDLKDNVIAGTCPAEKKLIYPSWYDSYECTVQDDGTKYCEFNPSCLSETR